LIVVSPGGATIDFHIKTNHKGGANNQIISAHRRRPGSHQAGDDRDRIGGATGRHAGSEYCSEIWDAAGDTAGTVQIISWHGNEKPAL